jgi:hypothetical protein
LVEGLRQRLRADAAMARYALSILIARLKPSLLRTTTVSDAKEISSIVKERKLRTICETKKTPVFLEPALEIGTRTKCP